MMRLKLMVFHFIDRRHNMQINSIPKNLNNAVIGGLNAVPLATKNNSNGFSLEVAKTSHIPLPSNPQDYMPITVLWLQSLVEAVEARIQTADIQTEEIKKINAAMDKLQKMMSVLNDLGAQLDKYTAKDKNKHINEKGHPDKNFTWDDVSNTMYDGKDVDKYDLDKILGNYNGFTWSKYNLFNSPLVKFLIMHDYIEIGGSEWNQWCKDQINAGKMIEFNWSTCLVVRATSKLPHGILDTSKMTAEELKEWSAIDKSKNIGDYINTKGEHINSDYFTLNDKRITHEEIINKYYSDSSKTKEIKLDNEIPLDPEIFKDLPDDFKKFTKTVYDQDGKPVTIISLNSFQNYIASSLKSACDILLEKTSVSPDVVLNSISGTQTKVNNAVSYIQKQIIDSGLSAEQQNLTKQLESLQNVIQKYVEQFMSMLHSVYRQ